MSVFDTDMRHYYRASIVVTDLATNETTEYDIPHVENVTFNAEAYRRPEENVTFNAEAYRRPDRSFLWPVVIESTPVAATTLTVEFECRRGDDGKFWTLRLVEPL